MINAAPAFCKVFESLQNRQFSMTSIRYENINIQIDYNVSTLSGTGCVCDFDPYQKLIDPHTDLPFDCACCLSGASQCGYPMHNFCKYDFDEPNQGCEGMNIADWFLFLM